VLSEEHPLRVTSIPIDIGFVNKYARGDVPDLSAGDMIFVMLAKGEALDLVAEDHKMLREARKLGVAAYGIREYLETFAPGR
jgi:hypothetical protein